MIPTETEILAGLRPWVETESPTEDPAAVNRMMDLAERDLLAAGAAVERIPGRDGAGDHLSARMPWGGDGPGILVLSHLDTVHPVGTLCRNPFRVEGDNAFGPGISDMKGGAFIALLAARSLREAGDHGPLPVRFLMTADEETGSETSRDLIERAAAGARYVLVTEPARSGGRIVTGRKGVGRYRLTVSGRAAHAGTGHSVGRSAIREMAHQVIRMEALTDPERGTTVNVGRIAGGTVINTVPDECVAEIDVRVMDEAAAAQVDTALKSLVPVDPDVGLAMEGGPNRPAYVKTPAIAALFEHARGLAAGIGFELRDLHTGGGSDGSFVAARVPTLDGLGVDGAGAHTLEEHLFVSSLVPRMRLLRGLFQTLS